MEAVADAKHGFDAGRVARIIFNFCTQVLDVRVNGALVPFKGNTLG